MRRAINITTLHEVFIGKHHSLVAKASSRIVRLGVVRNAEKRDLLSYHASFGLLCFAIRESVSDDFLAGESWNAAAGVPNKDLGQQRPCLTKCFYGQEHPIAMNKEFPTTPKAA